MEGDRPLDVRPGLVVLDLQARGRGHELVHRNRARLRLGHQAELDEPLQGPLAFVELAGRGPFFRGVHRREQQPAVYWLPGREPGGPGEQPGREAVDFVAAVQAPVADGERAGDVHVVAGRGDVALVGSEERRMAQDVFGA